MLNESLCECESNFLNDTQRKTIFPLRYRQHSAQHSAQQVTRITERTYRVTFKKKWENSLIKKENKRCAILERKL